MGSTNDRPEENDTTRQNQEIGMTPDQIQELIEIKRNLELQVVDLNNQKNYLQQQLKIYQQNAFNMHGQYQNLNAQAKFNNIQASQQSPCRASVLHRHQHHAWLAAPGSERADRADHSTQNGRYPSRCQK